MAKYLSKDRVVVLELEVANLLDALDHERPPLLGDLSRQEAHPPSRPRGGRTSAKLGSPLSVQKADGHAFNRRDEPPVGRLADADDHRLLHWTPRGRVAKKAAYEHLGVAPHRRVPGAPVGALIRPLAH